MSDLIFQKHLAIKKSILSLSINSIISMRMITWIGAPEKIIFGHILDAHLRKYYVSA